MQDIQKSSFSRNLRNHGALFVHMESLMGLGPVVPVKEVFKATACKDKAFWQKSGDEPDLVRCPQNLLPYSVS